jgi:hypothetical protein
MTLSHRELMLGWFTGFILLFAGSFVLCKPYIDTLSTKQEEREELQLRIDSASAFLEQKADWEQRLQRLQNTIKPLESGRSAPNYLKKVIGEMAGRANEVPKHSITFRDRKTGEETARGGLYMIPVTCNWDGNTQGIVKLLVDFLDSDVMFDTTELLVRSSGKDRLRGTFTVNCVFTRPALEDSSQ